MLSFYVADAIFRCHMDRQMENVFLGRLGASSMSHPEIVGFQDVIKIKNKTIILS